LPEINEKSKSKETQNSQLDQRIGTRTRRGWSKVDLQEKAKENVDEVREGLYVNFNEQLGGKKEKDRTGIAGNLRR